MDVKVVNAEDLFRRFKLCEGFNCLNVFKIWKDYEAKPRYIAEGTNYEPCVDVLELPIIAKDGKRFVTTTGGIAKVEKTGERRHHIYHGIDSKMMWNMNILCMIMLMLMYWIGISVFRSMSVEVGRGWERFLACWTGCYFALEFGGINLIAGRLMIALNAPINLKHAVLGAGIAWAPWQILNWLNVAPVEATILAMITIMAIVTTKTFCVLVLLYVHTETVCKIYGRAEVRKCGSIFTKVSTKRMVLSGLIGDASKRLNDAIRSQPKFWSVKKLDSLRTFTEKLDSEVDTKPADEILDQPKFVDTGIVRNKTNWEQLKVDLRHILIGCKNGKLKKKINCGRQWDLAHDAEHEFLQIDREILSQETLMHPVFLGLNSDLKDKNFIMALSNISKIFADAKLETLLERARSAIYYLNNQKTNHCRLLFRLLCMYHALAIEEKTGRTELETYNPDPKLATSIDGLRTMNLILTEAVSSMMNYVYIESSQMLEGFEQCLKTLIYATSDSFPFSANSALSKYWPALGSTRIIYLGDMNPVTFAKTVVTSNVVRHTIMTYVSQHGCEEVLPEMEALVSLLMARPYGDNGIYGLNKMQISLPVFDTRACALAMTLATARKWKGVQELAYIRYTEELLSAGINNYALMSLGHNRVMGKEAMHMTKLLEDSEVDEMQLMRFAGLNSTSFFQNETFGYAKQMYGKELNCIGSSLLLPTIDSYKESASDPQEYMKKVLQCEEMLHLTGVITDGSSLTAQLLNLRIIEDVGINVRYTTDVMEESLSGHDGMYAVADLGAATEIYLSGYDKRECELMHSKIKILENYRGASADNQFMGSVENEFRKIYYSFKILNSEAWMILTQGHKERKEMVWYVDHASDKIKTTKDISRGFEYGTGLGQFFKNLSLNETAKMQTINQAALDILEEKRKMKSSKKEPDPEVMKKIAVISAMTQGHICEWLDHIESLYSIKDPASEPGLVVRDYDKLITALGTNEHNMIASSVEFSNRSIYYTKCAELLREAMSYTGNRSGAEYLQKEATKMEMLAGEMEIMPILDPDDVFALEENLGYTKEVLLDLCKGRSMYEALIDEGGWSAGAFLVISKQAAQKKQAEIEATIESAGKAMTSSFTKVEGETQPLAETMGVAKPEEKTEPQPSLETSSTKQEGEISAADAPTAKESTEKEKSVTFSKD